MALGAATGNKTFMLGEFSVDPARNHVVREDQIYALEPRVMDVLCVLAAGNGEVVSRETLIAKVWNVEHGADESVTRVISVLRKTFRDAGVSDNYISTIPKRGYQLTQPVTFSSPIESDSDTGSSNKNLKRNTKFKSRHLVVLGLIGAALIAFMVARQSRPSPVETVPENSIAVLPFVSMSVELSDQLFAEGLSEELLNSLADIENLKVAARTSSFAYKGKSASVKEIGRELDVAYVLEGSIRRFQDRMRVTAQLIAVKDGYHLWSDSYDRKLEDVFAVQDDIAKHVVDALSVELSKPGNKLLFDAGTENTKAFQHYLEARRFLNRRGLGLSKAIDSFEAAIKLDSNYARAYAGLATAHVVSHIYLDVPKEIARSRAQSFARKASDLDASLSEPFAVLGVIEADQNNWKDAVEYYELGEALDPDNVVVLQWFAEVLTYVGYLERAEVKILKALEIEPESAVLNLVAGVVAQNKDDMEKTDYYYRRAEDFGLSDGVNGNSFVEFRRGNIETAAKMMALASFNDQYIGENQVDALTDFFIGIMSKQKKVDEGIGAFPVLANDDDFLMPAYLMSGESEKALRILEEDPDGDHDSFYQLWTNTDPDLRKHPYFQTFARNVGLYDYWVEFGWPDKCKPMKDDTSFVCD
ncbi:MAG: hypothetical protein HKO02_00030 [Hyphomonadaceae bacterium]|nr:hypothetical protein [Hyphomonadaceae bacterium]